MRARGNRGARALDREGARDSAPPRSAATSSRLARASFESTTLYARVFALADERSGQAVPRAVVPTIELHSAKFTRKLTTQWFAERVVTRHRACLARGGRVTAVPWTRRAA
jgi:hypothetical protein